MGDTIHFKFQPHAKKLLIDLANSRFKYGQYEIDLKDNVDYCPVIQSTFYDDYDYIEAHLVIKTL